MPLVAACAGVEHLLGRHADARRRLLAALDNAPDAQWPSLALELAISAFYLADGPSVVEWSQRVAGASGDPRLLVTADALLALGELWQGAPEAASARLDRAAAGFAALDDAQLATRVSAALDLAAVQLLHQRFAAAAATAQRGLDVARATHQGHVLVTLLTISAMAHNELLDMPAATAAIEAAEESARLQGAQHPLQFALWARAMVYDLCGDAPEAERAADECAALIDRLEPSNVTRTGRCNLAAIRADQDPERAIREMLEAAGPNLEDADPTWSTWLLGVLVRASLTLGREEDAERWARRASDQAAALQLGAGTARAACARAEILLAQGRSGRRGAARARGDRDGRARRRAPRRDLRADPGRPGAGSRRRARGGARRAPARRRGRRARRRAAPARRGRPRAAPPRRPSLRRGPPRRRPGRPRGPDRARARDRRPRRRGPHQQAGRGGALPLGPDDRAQPLAHLREARRSRPHRARGHPRPLNGGPWLTTEHSPVVVSDELRCREADTRTRRRHTGGRKGVRMRISSVFARARLWLVAVVGILVIAAPLAFAGQATSGRVTSYRLHVAPYVVKAGKTAPVGQVFGGTTSQQWPVVVEVSKDSKQIVHALSGLQFSCTSGALLSPMTFDYLKLPLSKKGKFGVTIPATQVDTLPNGQVVMGQGGITGARNAAGTKMKGTWTMTFTMVDPATGAVADTCSTGALTWTAKQ